MNSNNSSSGPGEQASGGQKSELDGLITSLTAPMPNSKIILTDYEAKKRKTVNQKNNKQGLASETDMSALEHNELDGPMIREFAIHILQSIHFL